MNSTINTTDSADTGPGSTGNVLAAICSFFIPGLGQLVQGRLLAAALHFILSCILWVVTFGWFGWIGNIISCWSAATYRNE